MDISAFANGHGAILMYGIEENDHLATTFDEQPPYFVCVKNRLLLVILCVECYLAGQILVLNKI